MELKLNLKSWLSPTLTTRETTNSSVPRWTAAILCLMQLRSQQIPQTMRLVKSVFADMDRIQQSNKCLSSCMHALIMSSWMLSLCKAHLCSKCLVLKQIFILFFLSFTVKKDVKDETYDRMQQFKKKAKELRILDSKTAQNLCTCFFFYYCCVFLLFHSFNIIATRPATS